MIANWDDMAPLTRHTRQVSANRAFCRARITTRPDLAADPDTRPIVQLSVRLVAGDRHKVDAVGEILGAEGDHLGLHPFGMCRSA